MKRLVTKSVATCQWQNATDLADDFRDAKRYDPGMVTRPAPKPKPKSAPKKKASASKHLFISEWIKELGTSDEKLGEKLGLPRQTIYRWRTEEHRLGPNKIALLAKALGIAPTRLWAPPEKDSVDALLTNATPDQVRDAVAFVERFILKQDLPPKGENN